LLKNLYALLYFTVHFKTYTCEIYTTKELWDKLGNLYQSNYWVNNLFLRKKLYHLRMEDGDSVTEHINAFNTLVSQLVSVSIMIEEEDKCITFFFFQTLGIF
jgi:hypothetical protein